MAGADWLIIGVMLACVALFCAVAAYESRTDPDYPKPPHPGR